MKNQASQIFTLALIVAPKISSNPENPKGRCRGSPTKIKLLYHLYQLSKNIKKGSWKEIFPSLGTLANGAKISRKHCIEFANHLDFSLFCVLKKRPGTSHKYILQPWVIEAFEFFEKTGMMKGFRSDFNKWKANFLKRVHNWLMPLLDQGLTLDFLLSKKQDMNSREHSIDKNKLKGDTQNGLKGDTMKSTSTYGRSPISSIKLEEVRVSNTECPDPIIQEFIEVNRALKDRFQLQDGDIKVLNNYYGFHRIKGGIRIMESWKENGMKPDSPIKAFMGAMKAFDKTKKQHEKPQDGILASNGRFIWNPRNPKNQYRR